MARRYAIYFARALLFIGIVIVGACFLHAPLNWIEVFAIAGAHGLWSVRETLAEDVGPLFDHPLVNPARRALSLEDEVLCQLWPRPAKPAVPTPSGAKAPPNPDQDHAP
jgi:hypothetical protein